jgi:autotransporter adhesin
VGSSNSVTGANSSAFGTGNTVNGTNSGAFGTGNAVTGNGSFAFGDPNIVNGNGTFATGNNNNINVPATVGNGDNINVFGSSNNVASTANASGSAILGNTNTVNAVNAIAVGNGSTVSGAAGISLGGGNNVAQAGAVAIGNGVTTTRANQIAVGNGGNTYTLAGINSAASLAAQTGAVRVVTADAAGNLATANITIPDVGGLTNQVSALDGRVGALESSVLRLRRDMQRSFEGTALAMAMAGAVLPAGKNYALSGGWGTYRGENAFAASGVARLTDNLYAQAAIGLGMKGGVGGRLGLTLAW